MGHLLDQSPATLVPRQEPGGEVEAEGALLIGRRDRVVVQGLEERVAQQRLEVRQLADGKAVQLLRDGGHDVLVPFMPAHPTAAAGGFDGVAGECGEEYRVETDAFGDGGMDYWPDFLAQKLTGGEP